MNQRWAELICVQASGCIAGLRGDRMGICSNLQRIEFDGSQGCVNPESSQQVNNIWRHVNGYKTIYDLVK